MSAPDVTLVETIEGIADDVADAVAELWDDLREQMGDRPAFSIKLENPEIAARYLWEWLIWGQAADVVSVPYWTIMAEKLGLPGPPDWRGASELDLKCRKFYTADPEGTMELVLETAPPEALQLLEALMAMGLHTGKPRPTDAQDERSDEPVRLAKEAV